MCSRNAALGALIPNPLRATLARTDFLSLAFAKARKNLARRGASICFLAAAWKGERALVFWLLASWREGARRIFQVRASTRGELARRRFVLLQVGSLGGIGSCADQRRHCAARGSLGRMTMTARSGL